MSTEIDLSAGPTGQPVYPVPGPSGPVTPARDKAARRRRSGAAMASLGGFLLQLVVVFVTFNLWEELAWMGFVQARLQDRHGAIRAALLTGPVFALGHISQVIEGTVATTLMTLTVLVAVCIPFRALQALSYNRTASLVPVALVHAAANATAAGSLAGAGLLDRLYPGDGAGGLVFPVLGALGLIAIVLTRGRLGRQSPARSIAHLEPVLTPGNQA